MSAGFEIATGVVGFASIGIQLFQGCIKGFILLSTAQNFEKDATLLRCKLEFEQFRLSQWAEKVGINSGNPSRNLNWEIINSLLKNLEVLLSDTEKFKREYRLELVQTEENLSGEDIEPPKQGLSALVSRCKPNFSDELERGLQTRATLWKRLKWAAIDKQGIGLLLGDIKQLINNLHEYLNYKDQEFTRNGIELLLRNVVSQATTPTELSNMLSLLDLQHSTPSKFRESAIETAIELKQKKFILGYNEESRQTSFASFNRRTEAPSYSSSIKPKVHAMKSRPAYKKPLSYDLLNRQLATNQQFQPREMALYNDQLVIVEWKYVETSLESKLKYRIKSLASLLEDVDSVNFRSLSCIGYLKDPYTGYYAYLFRPPPSSIHGFPRNKNGSSQQDTKFTSLAELVSAGNLSASLNHRFAIAIALAETVLQLHTAGWLHKGIRPDNILFFQQSDGILKLADPYLEGYEYARADNPSDMTESPVLQQEANLYRHPDLLRVQRPSFRKSHDLYALGCVLVELGLWLGMESILLNCLTRNPRQHPGCRNQLKAVVPKDPSEQDAMNRARPDLLNAVGEGSINEALEFAAGRRFTDVVMHYLGVGASRTIDKKTVNEQEEDEGEEEEEDYYIDLEVELVRELKSCIF